MEIERNAETVTKERKLKGKGGKSGASGKFVLSSITFMLLVTCI